MGTYVTSVSSKRQDALMVRACAVSVPRARWQRAGVVERAGSAVFTVLPAVSVLVEVRGPLPSQAWTGPTTSERLHQFSSVELPSSGC